MKVKPLSRGRLFAAPWSVADNAPPSMGFSRQEYWSGVPLPSPEDLPNSGIEPGSPTLQGDSLPSEQPGGQVSKKESLLYFGCQHLVGWGWFEVWTPGLRQIPFS